MCAIGGKMLASASLTLVWIFAAEVFPTLYRTVGVSTCLVGTRVGSSTAPFLLELRTYLSDSIPMITLAAAAVFASSLMLLLPETLRVTLPDTIRESKQLGNSRKAGKDVPFKDIAIDSKLQLAGCQPTAMDNDINH
ncbi:solute carrier family 22 member 15-like [Dermacentor silvarum]|uniref:solute carrier family 22 member 15-like n=1 Tax=Dermacentor silvarum TaxID=543639 RepID=UPI002100D1B0|nr:solute carrier family 22 member 15-like [Dermacentor silvarum]